MRSFPISLDEIEEHLNAIDGSGALELEHVIAMKRYDFICTFMSCYKMVKRKPPYLKLS